MLAIYVTKKWVEKIGLAADLILLTESKGDYTILMADEKSLKDSYPFVYAEVCRHPKTATRGRQTFIKVKIPSGEIAAIFDFTESDSKKIGFVA